MIEHEFILLGLLKDGPKHGYEIKQRISNILSLFAGVHPKSIYYPLGVLEKKGFIQRHLARSGKRPQRVVFALTAKGQTRFQELLTQSFLNFKRPQFSLDLSLFFLDHIRPEIARRKLRARMRLLHKLAGGLRQAVGDRSRLSPRSLALILEHDLEMVEAELKFLSHLTTAL